MDKITLGDRSFEVRPLKLGQLRGVLDATEGSVKKTGGAVIDSAARLLSAAIPDLSIDDDTRDAGDDG